MNRASLVVIALAAAWASLQGVAAADESPARVVLGDPDGRCGAWIDYFAVYPLPPGFEFRGGADFSGCVEKVASVLSLAD